MAAQLSSARIIRRATLLSLVDCRIREAGALRIAGLHAGCVYLAGYAVECQLKFTICWTLGWDELRATFKTHDLELLLMHSGVDARMRGNAKIVESFAKICEIWKPDTGALRYDDPAKYEESTSSLFMQCALDPEVGVITWLRKMTS